MELCMEGARKLVCYFLIAALLEQLVSQEYLKKYVRFVVGIIMVIWLLEWGARQKWELAEFSLSQAKEQEKLEQEFSDWERKGEEGAMEWERGCQE